MRWQFVVYTFTACFFLYSSGNTAEVDYQQHIKPILDKKCVVCHACFDAPCQLVLSHEEGLIRGANKLPVYNGLRTAPVEPTRLFIDASNNTQWRQRGFFSVLPENNDAQNQNDSILKSMLSMHQDFSFTTNEKLPLALKIGLKRKNSCPTIEEINTYKQNHPHGGMPLGAMGLTTEERNRMLNWLDQGAKITQAQIHLTESEQKHIQQWEALLNNRTLKHQLVARWLYEHLFIAHLYFSELDHPRFFQLVRSSTPPGKPVKRIVTRRPNDDPGQEVYYRIQPVRGTIVYKTHVTFPLNAATRRFIHTLFFAKRWDTQRLPGYSTSERANPFKTFSAIPAESRYRFMLEHAEYFVQTFIRGPVCHGQIATDVIRDHFWVFFQTPESDIYINSKSYRRTATPMMDIAGVEQDILEGAGTWFKVRKKYQAYSKLRLDAYEAPDHPGAGFDHIWDGNNTNTNALLTVFRHHDNASVRKGLIGEPPLTAWFMDYPLFERGFYNLVVNFDVFGSIAHQAQTRLYFDLIRNDAERNFLRLMPLDSRQKLIDNWYRGAAQLKLMTSYQDIYNRKPPNIIYNSAQPRQEFLQQLLEKYSHINAAPDPLNRDLNVNFNRRLFSSNNQDDIGSLRLIASRPARDLPAVNSFPEVSFLRVYGEAGRKEIYTLIRNRSHSNVAFLLGESLRYEPDKDTLTIYPGILASYPNFIFNVKDTDVNDFVKAIIESKSTPQFTNRVIEKWGVRRTHPDFWELFHELSDYLQQHTPVGAGIMDMSRYENL